MNENLLCSTSFVQFRFHVLIQFQFVKEIIDDKKSERRNGLLMTPSDAFLYGNGLILKLYQ